MNQASVQKKAEAKLPTRWGEFRILGFEGGESDGAATEKVVALVMGDVTMVRRWYACIRNA